MAKKGVLIIVKLISAKTEQKFNLSSTICTHSNRCKVPFSCCDRHLDLFNTHDLTFKFLRKCSQIKTMPLALESKGGGAKQQRYGWRVHSVFTFYSSFPHRSRFDKISNKRIHHEHGEHGGLVF